MHPRLTVSGPVALLLLAACGREEPPSREVSPPEVSVRIRQQETEASRTWHFTCGFCGSTMHCDAEDPADATQIELVYVSFLHTEEAPCAHVWERGISRAHRPPVEDGTLVLVRREGVYGAFVLEDQQTDPESMRYRWWLRSDGEGRLDEGPALVRSGTGEHRAGQGGLPRVEFGPFQVEWSGSTTGRGFLYYANEPGVAARRTDTWMCVTDAETIEGVDAAQATWRWKASPVDG